MGDIYDCRGYRWLVLGRFTIKTLDYEEREHGSCRVYYPGDIIKDRYFGENSWHMKHGMVQLLKPKFRDIDDTWEV
jgi:hypothetical protein